MTAEPPLTVEHAKAEARAIVERSGTSFGPGMRILSRPRREAMFAVYAYCRDIDDIADEPGALADKRRALADWRAEIEALYAGRPTRAISVALSEPIARYGLEKQEFILLLEGMEMDAAGPIVSPSEDELFAYTRRVAGAVGRLSMPIFGAAPGEASDRFALALADALQLTNILRDLEEDAADGRSYLPRERLERFGVPPGDPHAILAHPGLRAVCADLGATAKTRFQTARAALSELDWRVCRPALLMYGVYYAYWRKLAALDWRRPTQRITLSKPAKACIALKRVLSPPRAP
ncbi:MAG: presqualene diphosphate synthase HpnD [Maricaulaceae bacterium]